jgi:hypothetical protein
MSEPEFTRDQLECIAALLHYPDCWDTAAYPTLGSAIVEALQANKCTTCGDKS